MKWAPLISLLASVCVAAAQDSESLASSSVGLPVKIEQLVIPGPKVKAKPIVEKLAPIVVRIIDVYPHGEALRYDLEFYGLEPGDYDLRDYLQREDGSDLSNAPAIPVKVAAVLPAGELMPRDRPPERVGRFGGYDILLAALGTIWILGLWALFAVGRRRGDAAGAEGGQVLTFADRLRPLVKQAQSGELDDAEMARLERLLLGFWRDRLGLGQEEASTAVPKLRQHEEAGQLLRTIERWVHDPRGREEDVDVAKLLEPYTKEVAA